MGPRGRLAFDSLVAALHDPHGAVAGAAAEALAAVAGSDRADDARAALLARWEERPPYEQRVALVRAMGRLAPEAVPLDRLKAAFAEAPASDMKLAAAEGVLALEADRDLLGWLAAEMTAKVGDPAGAEALASRWLGAQGDSASEEGGSQEPGVTALRSLREAWAAAGPEANVVHNAAQATERRAARSAALAAYLLQ